MGARKGHKDGGMVGEEISVCLWFCMKGEWFSVHICVCVCVQSFLLFSECV